MTSKPLFKSTNQLAKELAGELERQSKKIVFAESCTAGLTAALLAQTSGISKWLCGSAVTYQESVKSNWLKIKPELIQRYTAVSPEVTEKMAQSVLELTPTANFSVAVTGHLEPSATDAGPLAYVSYGFRSEGGIRCGTPVRYRLQAGSRIERQWEAARAALNSAMEYLRFPPTNNETPDSGAKVCIEPINIHWDHRT